METPSGAESSNPFDELIFKRLLSEVLLLIDFVSGHPDRHIGGMDFAFRKPGDEKKTLDAFETITYVCKLGYPPGADELHRAADAALLLLVKDKLTSLAYPAKGVSIAYTYCFVEPMGSLGDWFKRLVGRGNDSTVLQTQATVAREAYPALYRSARRFRGIHRLMIFVSILLTTLSAALLWMVAYGVQITSRFEEDRLKNAVVERQIYERISAQDALLPFNQRKMLVPWRRCGELLLPQQTTEVSLLCNEWAYTQARYDKTIFDTCVFARSFPTHLLMWLFPSEIGQSRELCGTLTQSKKALGASATTASSSTRPSSEGKAAPPGRRSGHDSTIRAAAKSKMLPHGASSTNANIGDALTDGPTQQDVQSVTLVLAVYSNYVLPILFGFLGTAASTLRSIGNKISGCVLGPRDPALAYLRIPIGIMAGLAVGLFFDPASVAKGISLGTATLTITASGIAFLAGYGADSFFKVVDRLVDRFFGNAQHDKGKH